MKRPAPTGLRSAGSGRTARMTVMDEDQADLPSLERRPSVIDERCVWRGGDLADHDFGCRFEEDIAQGWEGWVSDQVCVFISIKRDIFHCPNYAPSHFQPPQKDE